MDDESIVEPAQWQDGKSYEGNNPHGQASTTKNQQ
jgi:hypothetical protein